MFSLTLISIILFLYDCITCLGLPRYGVSLALGIIIANVLKRGKTYRESERDYVLREYIVSHPEDFPPPGKIIIIYFFIIIMKLLKFLLNKICKIFSNLQNEKRTIKYLMNGFLAAKPFI
jgi:hypothetical protein